MLNKCITDMNILQSPKRVFFKAKGLEFTLLGDIVLEEKRYLWGN